MKKIKVVNSYYDLKLKKNVAVGDELTVSDDRAAELCSLDNKAGIILAELIELDNELNSKENSKADPDIEPEPEPTDVEPDDEPVKKPRKKKTED